MTVDVSDEELRLAQIRLVMNSPRCGVGLELGLSGTDTVTLWFESKAALDQWLSDRMYQVQQSGG